MSIGIWIKDLVDMENNIFHFENLVAYQRGLELVTHVYEVIKNFPREEQYALCDQLRRAVVSIPSNIAEGMGRFSNKEKAHYLEIAYGSLMEVFCQLNIAHRLGYITDEKLNNFRKEIEFIAKPISGLRKSLLPNPSTSFNR